PGSPSAAPSPGRRSGPADGASPGLRRSRSAGPSDVTLALAAEADLLAALVEAVAGPGRPAGPAVEGDVGDVDRHVLVDDAALHRRRGRALVLLGDVDAFDDDLGLVGEDAHDHAVLAEVLPGAVLDAVAFLELVVLEHFGW